MEEKVTKYSTGVCQFCGQSIALAGAHATQEEADTVAALACKCAQGQPFRQFAQEKATIQDLFGRDDPNAQALIVTLADAVREGYIEGGTLKLADGVTAADKRRPAGPAVAGSRQRTGTALLCRRTVAQNHGRIGGIMGDAPPV